MSPRQLSPFDRLLAGAGNVLRTLAAPPAAARPNPADGVPDAPLDEAERRHVAALMRVNHAGEVAAQALYHGQALVARDPRTAEHLATAAQEEEDHLAWCRERLQELGGRPSHLDPLWYLGAFGIGALASLAGDRYSLGFVEETEKQVVAHLEKHRRDLPAHDERTRRILEVMAEDEARHGDSAHDAGAQTLPAPIRGLMRIASRVMTTTAYRI